MFNAGESDSSEQRNPPYTAASSPWMSLLAKGPSSIQQPRAGLIRAPSVFRSPCHSCFWKREAVLPLKHSLLSTAFPVWHHLAPYWFVIALSNIHRILSAVSYRVGRSESGTIPFAGVMGGKSWALGWSFPNTEMAIFFRNYNLTAKPLTIVVNEPRFIRWLKDDKSVSFLRSLAFMGSLNSFNLAPSLYRRANEGAERGADRLTEGT